MTLETAAGGCVLDAFGGLVDAFAPDLPADACVEEPADGLETWTCVDGDETLGLAETDVEPPPPVGGFTLTVTGALTCGFAFTGAGGAGAGAT